MSSPAHSYPVFRLSPFGQIHRQLEARKHEQASKARQLAESLEALLESVAVAMNDLKVVCLQPPASLKYTLCIAGSAAFVLLRRYGG